MLKPASMKTLSGIIVMLVLLIGAVFLFMANGAHATGKTKCQGKYEVRFGLDKNGCEKVEPIHASENQIETWINGVPKTCYKIRNYVNHQITQEWGDLDVVECIGKASAESTSTRPQMFQPSGSGQTQRIMFNTPPAKEAFEKKIKAAKK
jgi:hypothetical protein